VIRLVVNAEGFGASVATNALILQTHRTGIVTSTALVGNCPDTAGAAASLREAPALGVGLSLALLQGKPVAPPVEVSSLLTESGEFRTRAADFGVDWVKGHIRPEHVEREMELQIARARAAGLELDHLSTRGHVGLLPGVAAIVERLARRHKIPGLRTTVEPPTLAWITDARRGLETGVLAGLAWLSRRRLGPLRHGPRSWGYLDRRRLDEIRVLEIIGRLGPGSHELICHPGNDGADAPTGDTPGSATMELAALMSPRIRAALDRREIRLCRWRDLF
jgi:predicted glycoside hydrolase/deacetylase ChbG (UPF0249 family)